MPPDYALPSVPAPDRQAICPSGRLQPAPRGATPEGSVGRCRDSVPEAAFPFPSAGQDDRSPPATSGCLGCQGRVSDFRAETSPTAGTSTIRQISVQPDQRASCYRTSDRRFSAPLPDQTAGLWRLIQRHKANQRSAEWHLPAGGTPVHARCRCAQAALTDAGWE